MQRSAGGSSHRRAYEWIRSARYGDRLRTGLSCSSQTRLRKRGTPPNITPPFLAIFPGERMKISYAAVLALALPVSLVAQQPSGGPPANPVTAAFRGRTMGLQRSIAQAFDSIPEAKFGYKPTPAQLTIGYIAQHLVSDNYLFCNAFGDMKATQAPKDTATADSVKAKWPK